MLTSRVDDVWRKKHLPQDSVIFEEDLQEEGYYEDMYPTLEAEELTRFGSEAATVELDPFADVKVEVEQEEGGDGVISLPAAVHVTSHAYTNLVFDVRFVIVC